MENKFGMKRILLALSFAVAAALTIFQFYTGLFGVFTAVYQRAAHWGLVSTYIFLFNLSKPSPKLKWLSIPVNVAGLLASIGATLYICINFVAIQNRLGLTLPLDVLFGVLLIVSVLICGYETLGWALPSISLLFLIYALYGHLLPGALGHQAFTLKRLVSFLYLGTEGIYGSAMSVSATFIFMFILFGVFLEKTGAGQFFVDIALAGTGKMAGGPAMAAVVSSALMGTISGSGVSNVVTTGTFTIPLMKSCGYDKNFAGAVEAVASNGGQIMPPVMGSVAFLMAEIIGMSYFDVAKAAAVPALLYFAAVAFAVYFEAKRLNLATAKDLNVAPARTVLKNGFYYLLPVALLIYMLIAGFSVLRAGVYATLLTIAISYLKKSTALKLKDYKECIISVAKQVMPIAAACACAGIIMGVASLTGLGVKLSTLIVNISGGHLIIALVITMLVSLVMGMGLPTTAAYLLLAVLGAPALISMGTSTLSAHLFILYFGCMSTITPPVALSTYAAAGISGGSPWKTGIDAMRLAMVAFLIPYIFVYNSELLLIGETADIILAILTALLGCVALAGGIIGWLGNKTHAWERILLICGAMGLLIPGVLTDVIGLAIVLFCLMECLLRKRREKRSV